MRKINLLLLLLLLASCQKELIEPIDVFEVEIPGDTLQLALGNGSQAPQLYVNADRIDETEYGYHIKGTIFGKSLSGFIPLTAGEFVFSSGSGGLKSGMPLDFNGYGTADLPAFGLLDGFDFTEIPGADVYYNTGSVFKEESKSALLPLQDETYYFRYKLDKGKKKGKEFRKGQMTLLLEEHFLDPTDPAMICTGSVFSKNKKTNIKTKIIEHGAIGISANEQWEWEAPQFSERLEEISGGTGFVPMNGGIYFGGIIPIKKYPLKIEGESVINTSFSSSGMNDFFERGFDEASFQMGINGTLFFSKDLIPFLPLPDTLQLAQASLQTEFSDESASLRLAGEYSTDCLSQFLGAEMTQLLPHTSREGLMYARCTDDPDDFLIYLEQQVNVSVPGMGDMPLQNSIFSITKDSVGFSGFMALPYGIGEVDVRGVLHRDGSFLLKGSAESGIDLGGGLAYEAALDIEISNSGIVFTGNMDLPFNLLQAEIEGGLTLDEVWFTGSLEGNVTFAEGVSLHTNLSLTASSKTGVALEGGLNLPAGIGNVGIRGDLFYDHFALTGTIDAGLNMNFYDLTIKTGTSMSLTVDSRSGVRFAGSVKFPFNFGSVHASITIEPGNVLEFTGKFGSGLAISGVSVFDIDLFFTVNSTEGLYMWGHFYLPGDLGGLYGKGWISDHGFYFHGHQTGIDIDFKVITLETSIDVYVRESSVKIEASGSGSVAGISYSPSISIHPDWGSGHVEMCVDFILGQGCFTL